MTCNRSDAPQESAGEVDWTDEFGYYEDAETEPVTQTLVWVRNLVRRALRRIR